MSSSDVVRLQCRKVAGKLRVNIISPGYNSVANCRFPRAIRAEGAFYEVPAADVTFSRGPRGTLFYVVKPARIRQIPLGTLRPETVYEASDDPECSVCLEQPKSVVFVPCGHFCCCDDCSRMVNKRCPMCRSDIIDYVQASEL